MEQTETKPAGWVARQKQNTLRLGFWTAAWVVTLAIAVFGPVFAWQNTVLTAIAVVINLAAGTGMIVANKNHLRGLDEMQQKIQLEAMALALGVGLVAGLGYSTLSITNLITFDPEFSHLVFLVCFAYGIGIVIGRRKYQ